MDVKTLFRAGEVPPVVEQLKVVDHEDFLKTVARASDNTVSVFRLTQGDTTVYASVSANFVEYTLLDVVITFGLVERVFRHVTLYYDILEEQWTKTIHDENINVF